MIKAILIDDEVHCLDTLNILLTDFCPNVEVLQSFVSAKKASEALSVLKPELVFLDIEMPVLNGFEWLEQFQPISFAVIFTTSYDQYAIKAIRSSALDYLLKPVDPKELVAAVGKVQLQNMPPSMQQFQMLIAGLNKKDGFEKIAVPTAEGYELIPADQVVRCEADDNYTHFYLLGKTKITACRTLKEIETQLQDYSFFIRVHHSYIVNLNAIVKYVRGEGGYLVMNDGSIVNVSRHRKAALLKRFA